MKLSILIPMYNAENYIGNCLESLIMQDIHKDDYEIVVLDDESKDDSVKIVEQYALKYPNIHLHKQKNQGTSITRNNLLKLAKGEYIYNIDNDDYISHNTLGTLLNYALEYDLDIVAFDILETTKMDLYECRTTKKITKLEVSSGVEFWAKSSFHHLAYWWYFIKRDFMEKKGVSFLKGNPLADTLFTFNIFINAERVIHVPMDVYRYVNVPTSVMNKTNATHLRKMVAYHAELIHNLDELLGGLAQKKDGAVSKMKEEIRFWKDINVYFMFKKFLNFNISRKEIKTILIDLEQIGAYPMMSFTGERCFSKQHKYLTYFFNHKGLFFGLLGPVRAMIKANLIKLPVR